MWETNREHDSERGSAKYIAWCDRKHKSDSIKLLAARVQRGNCQGFQITQNSIVNATRVCAVILELH